MPENAVPAAQSLAYLLEQTGRALHAQGYAADLFPAQWSALRYFSRAEPHMRTASELARFQGLATGPVTRTVRTLIQKGLLAKGGFLGRGRAERIDVTPAGEALLASDPLDAVVTALGTISDQERQALANGLETVLRHLQTADEAPAVSL